MGAGGKLVELLDEFYGCDPMYYGVDALAIAQHLIANGVASVVHGHWNYCCPRLHSYPYPLSSAASVRSNLAPFCLLFVMLPPYIMII